MAAVRAVGNLVCKSTVWRDAVVEAGIVDKLGQVRGIHVGEWMARVVCVDLGIDVCARPL